MDISLLPRFLQVELTYACNSKCSFCYNPTHLGKLDEDVIFRVLREVNSYKLPHVQLIGGEVSILPNLPKYLQTLSDTRWRSVVTNGRRYREDIQGLVDEIYLSLHGNSEVHEELTSEPGSFLDIESSIKKYVDWGIDVNSDTVLTKYNFDQIYSLSKYAQDIGMKRLFLNIFQPEGIGSARRDFSPTFYQIKSAIDQMLEAKEVLGFDVIFGTSTPLCLDKRLLENDLNFKCGVGDWFASINPQGEFRICNHSKKSYGNILDVPLNKIWHSKSIDDSYRNVDLTGTLCEGCPAFKLCRGGCRISTDGTYRTDPIVVRDSLLVLSSSELKSLLQ